MAKKEPRLDKSITKKCAVCGKDYHPRKNGYQTTSRFCSQQCSRKARGMNIPEFE